MKNINIEQYREQHECKECNIYCKLNGECKYSWIVDVECSPPPSLSLSRFFFSYLSFYKSNLDSSSTASQIIGLYEYAFYSRICIADVLHEQKTCVSDILRCEDLLLESFKGNSSVGLFSATSKSKLIPSWICALSCQFPLGSRQIMQQYRKVIAKELGCRVYQSTL